MDETKESFRKECVEKSKSSVYQLYYNLIDSEDIDCFEKKPVVLTQDLRDAIQRFQEFPEGLFSVTGHWTGDGRLGRLGPIRWFRGSFPKGDLEDIVRYVAQTVENELANHFFQGQYPNENIWNVR